MMELLKAPERKDINKRWDKRQKAEKSGENPLYISFRKYYD